MKKILSTFVIMLSVVVLCCDIALASPVDIVAEGEYTFKTNDTRETAKKEAIKDAMRYAAEQGAVYVKAYSDVNKLNLTKDEIEIVTAAIVKVYDEKIEYSQNGIVCHAIIYCAVDTDNIDVDKILNSYRGERNENSDRQQDSQPSDPQVRYTGVIIDTSGIDTSDFMINGWTYTPMSIMAEDGRIVYDAMTPEPKFPGKIVYESRGYDADNVAAGERPYWAKALYTYNPDHERFTGTLVISNADADAILAQQNAYGILNGKARGHIVVIYHH